MMFAGDFPPRDCEFCNGQILEVSMFTPLFSVIGNTFGGDGLTTFALPDLRGRVPVAAGAVYPYGQNYLKGINAGEFEVSLDSSQLPAHTHKNTQSTLKSKFTFKASTGNGNTNDPTGAYLTTVPVNLYTATGRPEDVATQSMGELPIDLTQDISLPTSGESKPHNNMQPYQVLNFVIVVNGIHPSKFT